MGTNISEIFTASISEVGAISPPETLVSLYHIVMQ
jgi:hypothetical protein